MGDDHEAPEPDADGRPSEPPSEPPPRPPLGWGTGLLTVIQLTGMTTLVVGITAIIAGDQARMSLWLFVLAAAAAVIAARSRTVRAAAGGLAVATLAVILIAQGVSLGVWVAPGIGVLIGSLVALAATVVVTVWRRDAPRDEHGRTTKPAPRHIVAVGYGVPLLVIAGGALLTLLLRR